ncbi:MAG: RluA family pseudouridine synthase [Desulfuromonadales bacterium]|nr:RluA family pseudouridine synthase [Desulfuromonadales bacterium]MDW7757906.1 RluA family pseudouridine synthase [Desulfuromonadales bacterium]
MKNQESTKHRHRLAVANSCQGQRLDRFLTDALPGVSRKQIKRALDRGAVFLNDSVEKRAGRPLQGGERIDLTVETPSPATREFSLPIIYQDDDVLAVAKPPGLPVHANVAGAVNALDLVRQLIGSDHDPILLHRLDADTTGVLLFALNRASNRSLCRQFSERRVEKTYLALVQGCPAKPFEVRDHLRPNVRGKTVKVLSGGQPAWTSVNPLSCHNDIALVAARPHTGRTHQIRAHLAGSGHPLLGDTLYGGPTHLETPEGPVACSRHMLHAAVLVVTHPRTDRPLTLQAPLPADFSALLSGAGLKPPDYAKLGL